MTFAVSLPSSPSAQPFFDSGCIELQRWRKRRIEATYDNTAPLLFALAIKLTNNRAEAEESIVRAFTELGQETSVLADGIPSRQRWLLCRVARHCHVAHAGRNRFRFFAPKQTGANEHSFGRILYTFLSQSGKPSAS